MSNRLTAAHSLSVYTSGCLSIALGHQTRLVCHSYRQPRSAPSRQQTSKKNNAYQVAFDKHLYHRHGVAACAAAVIDGIQFIANATYYEKILPHQKNKVNTFSKIIAKLLKKHTTIYSLMQKNRDFSRFFSLFCIDRLFF